MLTIRAALGVALLGPLIFSGGGGRAATPAPRLSPERGVIVNTRPFNTAFQALEPWISGIGYLRVWGGSRGMATYPGLEAVPAPVRSTGRFSVVADREIEELLRLQERHGVSFIYLVNVNDSLESQRAFVARLLERGLDLVTLEMGNELYLEKYRLGRLSELGVARRITVEDYVEILRTWVPVLREFGIPIYACAASYTGRATDLYRQHWNQVLRAAWDADPTLYDGVTFHIYRGKSPEEDITSEEFSFLAEFAPLPVAITESGYYFAAPSPERLEEAAAFWTKVLWSLKPGDLFGVHVLFHPPAHRDNRAYALYDESGLTPTGTRFATWLVTEYRRWLSERGLGLP